MARRSRDWNEGLAEDLQDPEFAREFLTAAVEGGVPLKSVGVVGERLGYCDLQFFSKQFKQVTGTSPAQFRQVPARQRTVPALKRT